MRYSFRLAELLGHVPDPRRRPGTIKAIVSHTGLDRHQVAALLKNEVKYIPLDALSRLCDYLIEQGHATADQLPGALFAIEPESFWELLARRKRLELCMGVRPVEEDWHGGAWVVASDSLLLGALLNGVSTVGGTAEHRREADAALAPPLDRIAAPPPGVSPGSPKADVPHPEYLTQSLVWSPSLKQLAHGEVVERANSVYQDFSNRAGDKALVCLGSIKSNPVVELIQANMFDCEPFKSQDDVDDPGERACPFFFRLRDQDPQLQSCGGGVQLANGHSSSKPGIYYETKNGEWKSLSWDEPKQDAAIVLYVHRESHGRLEMILGGFSGRATRLLARTLATRAQDFWPPTYDRHGIQIGAFLVRYRVEGQPNSRDILRTDLTAQTHVIRIDEEVIARRLEARE